MSLARLYTTAKVRKDWECGKCGAKIRKGVDGRISFAVGFRGFERTRCLRPECYPTRAERESSMLAEIYAAVDGIDFSNAGSLEDLTSGVEEVQAAIESVKDEYESNPMFEINEDLQERVSLLEAAHEELEGWDSELDEAPEDEPSCDECEGTGEVEDDSLASYTESPEETQTKECPACQGTGEGEPTDEFDEWLDAARELAETKINELELP